MYPLSIFGKISAQPLLGLINYFRMIFYKTQPYIELNSDLDTYICNLTLQFCYLHDLYLSFSAMSIYLPNSPAVPWSLGFFENNHSVNGPWWKTNELFTNATAPWYSYKTLILPIELEKSNTEHTPTPSLIVIFVALSS